MYKTSKTGIKIGLTLFGIVLLISVAISFVGWNRIRSIEDRLHKVEEVNLLINGMLETLEKEKRYIISKDQKYLDEVKTEIDDINRLAANTKDLFSDPNNRKLMDNIISASKYYLIAFHQFVEENLQVESAFHQWYNANKEIYRLDKYLHDTIIFPKTRKALSTGDTATVASCAEVSHKFREDIFKNFLSLRISAIYYIMLKSETAWKDYENASSIMYEGLNSWSKMIKDDEVMQAADKIRNAIDTYGGAGLRFRKIVFQQQRAKATLIQAARKLEIAGGEARMDQKQKLRSLIAAEYKAWIWSGIAVIISLSLLILLLSINMMRRVKAEEALNDSLEKRKELEKIINFSPAVVFLWKPSEKWPIELVSDNVNQFGYNPEDFYTGKVHLSNFIHPDDFPRISEQMNPENNHGKNDFIQEYRILTRDGKIRWVDVRIWIRRNPKGEITHYQGIALDITKRKEAENEKKDLEKQLRQSQKLETIGRLAGGIAHDFNNILQMIFSYAYIVYDELPEHSLMAQDQMHVINAAERATSLVDQILTFSRQVDQELKPLQLHIIVKEALNMLQALMPANIEVTKDIDSNIPNVMADPTQIHQVVVNLCTNAFQAMSVKEEGSLEVSLGKVNLVNEPGILVNEPKNGDYIRLRVSDNGSGMTTETMERIFEPFFTTKAVGEGTGLGLSVVHGIIKTHEGDIQVYSKPEGGSTFVIDFPVTQKTTLNPPLAVKTVSAGNESILFVDDEIEIIGAAKNILEKSGFNVTIYSDASKAFEAFIANPDDFDLIITDQSMPKMTGTQLAEEIRKTGSKIPIILTTGFSETVNIENYQNFGFDLYIKKPVNPELLKSSIRKLLDV